MPNLIAVGKSARVHLQRSAGKKWDSATHISRSLKIKNRPGTCDFPLVIYAIGTFHTVSVTKVDFGQKKQTFPTSRVFKAR